MNQAVIYTRVSTEEQVSNYSLDSQRDTCLNYSKTKKLEVQEFELSV